MEKVGLYQRSNSATSCNCHTASSTRTQYEGCIFPHLAKHIQDQLWQKSFSKTSAWWDNRLVKKILDCRVQTSREGLSLRNRYKLLCCDFDFQPERRAAGLQNGMRGLQLSSASSSGLSNQRISRKVREQHSKPANIFRLSPFGIAAQLDTLDAELQPSLGGLEGSLSVGSFEGQRTAPLVARYKSLLKACIKSKALAEAKKLHVNLAKDGLELSKHLGETVVSTLVKCGGLEDGFRLFQRLPRRTVVSWTAVISGFTQAGLCQEALTMYENMIEEGVHPNEYTFASLLKASGSVGNLEMGKRIHADAVTYGCESDLFVGTTLVDMYSKCGSMTDAQIVFDGLPQRDVVLWTAMLRAYAEQGQGKKVLELFKRMQEEGVSPNDWTLVSAIQACGSLADQEDSVLVDEGLLKVHSMQKGKAIHAEVQRRGFNSDLFICSSLVGMYAKCGSISDAQTVFDTLSNRNVVLWTTMVATYVQLSQPDKALQLYVELQMEGVVPNDSTVLSTLQACCTLAEKEASVHVDGHWLRPESLQKTKAIHAEVKMRCDEEDAFVGSTLITSYGKCGSIMDAEGVFQGLVCRDIVLWTAMHVIYVQQGLGDKALHLYEDMNEEGVSPNNWTFVSALQACGTVAEKEEIMVVDGQLLRPESLQKGIAVHAEAQRRGYTSDLFMGNALVSMYGKCGSIRDAQLVFDGLAQQDRVSWNAMLTGYSQQGHGLIALQLYEQMRGDGASPDDRTLVSILQACGSIAELENDIFVDGEWLKVESLNMGKAIHAEAHVRGYDSDVFVGNTLVTMYGRCGSMLDSEAVFDGLRQRDVVTWNAMLAAYAFHSRSNEMLQLYGQMAADNISPDDTTLIYVLQACGNEGALRICVQMHSYIMSSRKDPNLLLANALVQAYAKCSSMEDAQAVFIALPQPNVASWNSLIAGYAYQGNYETSLQCYDQMLLSGVRPDAVTFLSVLSACSHAGLVDRGMDYFESMSRDHGISSELEHYATMVDLLGRAGLFPALEDLLSKMPMQPDVTLWRCVLSACQKHGNVVLAWHAFNCAVHLEPRSAAAYALMSNIFAEAGMWESAKRVHELRVEAGAWKKPGQSWIDHEQEVHSFTAGDGESFH